MVILFDLDDTLLDHGAAFEAATAALHARVGLPGSLSDFVAAWRAAHRRHFDRYLAGVVSYADHGRARVRDVFDAGLREGDADELFAYYRERYRASWALFPDVEPCLDRLSPLRLGVVTNGRGDEQRLKLDRTGLAGRFECVVVSEEYGSAKPAPGIFLHACGMLGADPHDSIYVGDLYDTDVVGARGAGLRAVWLDRLGTASAGHVPPLVSSLDQLPQVVDALGR
jgi:putative hydrolase of the HAD superfamily